MSSWRGAWPRSRCSTLPPRSSIIFSIATTCCAGCCRRAIAVHSPDSATDNFSTMRIHQQLRYFLILVLVCGSVALAATKWTVQPKESKLTFVGIQQGAEFTGVFERFTADIQFDPQDLAGSRFDVKIETASAKTRDDDRDSTLLSDDFFAVKQYPTAHYVTDR